jgi:hypothetical protein
LVLSESAYRDCGLQSAFRKTVGGAFRGGFGRVFRIGNQPINGQIAAYYNSIRPDDFAYPGWSVRFQIALLFPTPK